MEENYSFSNYKRVDERQLTFIDKIYLGVILRTSLSENGKVIKNIGSAVELLTPTHDFTTELILSLTNKHILVPSLDSSIDAFSFNELNECNGYYIFKVNYMINIEPIDKYSFFTERMMYPNFNIIDELDAFLIIWKKMALSECLGYFLNQMSEVGYDFTIGDITIKTFERLLESFSPAQIYNLIFRAVSNSTRAYQSGQYSKKHAMNMVVASCRNQGEKALAEKWDLKPYGRIKQLPESEISRFLFTSILQQPEVGFSESPTMCNLEKIVNI